MSTWNPHANEIFLNALELAEAGDRQAYLIEVCAGDAGLRAEVESLLAAHEDSSRLLDSPAGSVTVAAATVAERPSTVIGRYKLLEQIGEGGMGLVYMAEQTEPVRRRVALKIIKPGMDSRQIIGRFEAERQALAMMDHPNIARVIDGGQTDTGRPYFVMELVRGTPITEYCDEQRLTTRDRLELFRQVCAAVQHAHQKGIIHRDIKPSNVLVASNDGVPTVKVIDFGIAKAIGQPLTDKTIFTHFVQFVGTPAYMSPEQAGQSSIDVDTRTDVYALGVLLYELLTGTTPFEKERLKSASYEEIRRIIREEEPPRPSTRVSTLNQQAASTASSHGLASPRQFSLLLRGDLDWIVMKALEKDRNRRYESPGALAADIERHLTDEPVVARPPSVAYRLRKFSQRHRVKLMAATALALAVGIVGTSAVYSAWEHHSRTTLAARRVSEQLASARTAIEAGDLALADRKMVEAEGLLDPVRELLPDSGIAVKQLRSELEKRRAEVDRFQQLRALAVEGQERMTKSSSLLGLETSQKALRLYGVLDRDDWWKDLDASFQAAEQKNQIREVIYETLISIAAYHVRWSPAPDKKALSLDLLRRAEAFHTPTRAFYFIRSQCHQGPNRDDLSKADQQRFKSTKGTIALDYFLPGHSAGSRGDMDEAIREYRAALRLQPNHYDSMYFLASSFHAKRQYAEAAAYHTGAIALGKMLTYNYLGRATCHYQLGKWDIAEEDYASAESTAQSDDHRAQAIDDRANFFLRIGRPDKAATELERLREILPNVIALRRQKYGERHEFTLETTYELAMVLANSGQTDAALRHLDAVFQADKGRGRAERWQTAETLRESVALYKRAGRRADGLALLHEFVKTCAADDNYALSDAFFELGHEFESANDMPEAIKYFELALRERTSKPRSGNDFTNEIASRLARAYEKAGQRAKALAVFQSLMEKWLADLAPNHEATLGLLGELAQFQFEIGQKAEGVKSRELILERCKRPPGDEALADRDAIRELAVAYLKAERFAESIATFQRHMALEQRDSGRDSLSAVAAADKLGNAFLAAGRHAEAIALMEPALARRLKLFGSEAPQTVACRKILEEGYRKSGRIKNAVRPNEQSLSGPADAQEWREKLNGAPSPSNATEPN